MLKSEYSAKKVFVISILSSFAIIALSALLGPRLDRFPHLPDQGAAWYYWKLPAPEMWARITSWTGYALHQIFVWVVFILALKEKPHPEKASKLNVIALLGNAFFILLHLLQTHIFYDGLAQDVPVWSSQWSVIVMLAFILILMMPRRGLILGVYKTPPKNLLEFLKKYHGFYIGWALVYTFWFHPIEGNWGLQSGFLYMYFLFIQLSMANTRIHFNTKWITLLEFMVTIHAVMITTYKSSGAWPMFLFGFLFMFAFTQIFGLTKKKWLSFGVLSLYIIAAVLVYSLLFSIGEIYEISFIPGGLYGMALAFILLFWPLQYFKKKKSQ